MRIDRERIVISFANAGSGLENRGGSLTGFAIAGPDRKFVNAQAAIADIFAIQRLAFYLSRFQFVKFIKSCTTGKRGKGDNQPVCHKR
jgi:hypothetical protein